MHLLKKPTFLALVAVVATLIVVPVVWITLLIMQGESPNPLVVAAVSLVGPVVGAFVGYRFWDDREAMRQRIAEEDQPLG